MGDFIDLTGLRIGNWKVLEYVGEGMWKCECQCENKTVKNVHSYSLRMGTSTSCGKCNIKASIKIGDHFGEWEVIGEKDKKYRVPCRCSCGKEKMVSIYSLKDGRSTNCGHLKNLDRVIDLTGQTFGELTVKRYLGGQYWECECSCGELCVKNRNHLLDGRATSCGHATKPKPENLKGLRFGDLEVIEYVGNKSWMCKCSCGNSKVVRSCNLKNGSTVSCGCKLYTPTEKELIELINKFTKEFKFKPSVMDLAEYTKVSHKSMYYHLSKFDLNHSNLMENKFVSAKERELYKYILSLTDKEVLHNVFNIINPYELDIYIPDKKIAIEFNGNYWHSDEHKDDRYHQKKAIECDKKGIQLIHVYEYEWDNEDSKRKIKNLIRNRLDENPSTVLYARKLDVRLIENNLAVEFCNKYHLQNGINASINIGLYCKDYLVGVMTFGTPRFSNECEYELIRMAYRDDIKVVGGAHKMLKYFIEKYNPKSILSYCNIDKFSGKIYELLGFECIDITKPNYIWVNHSDVLTRYQTTKEKLTKLGYPDEWTEHEIMHSLGYMRVCNSGNKRYIWENKN